MNGPAVPMTQQQIARNRRIIVLVAVVFVASSVGILLWAMNVVGSQRDRARGTDAALRSVAWAVLSYAAANDGAFPTSDLALAGAALVLPRCNTEGMTLHLAEICAAAAPGAPPR